ncbi:MAG TPA: FkbM family methyltransferase [Candidatus Acidoferrum sp.]|nr:FkbM family methyltransferase [Candidatus Acidoferrum sp.]
MISTTTLAFFDGVRIVVPDSLQLITPYVIAEQQDWFEDEIKFLRRLLQPGERVIDIGANYGVYTLSMAKTVGVEGHVWAFEPAPYTARLLSEGISSNNFTQITLVQSALSNLCGSARLSISPHSELNALIHGESTAGESEIVPVVTLDDCLEKYGWHEIDFMKIDAEGEETNILKGGTHFFAKMSPLIQYEIKAGTELNLRLVKEFASIGYDSYLLVPGLDLLAPFDASSPPDGYLLNLFCCKPERARQLSSRGFLTSSGIGLSRHEQDQSDELFSSTEFPNTYHWRKTLARLPYGILLADRWEQTKATETRAEIGKALTLYFFSQDISQSARQRIAALGACVNQLVEVCERQPTSLQLCSLARAARDYGARSLAVNALGRFINSLLQNKNMALDEPFLPPGKRFDSLVPGEDMNNWLLASALEEFETLSSFSSFYLGASSRQRLEVIGKTGFASPEMKRRLQLLTARFGSPAAT